MPINFYGFPSRVSLLKIPTQQTDLIKPSMRIERKAVARKFPMVTVVVVVAERVSSVLELPFPWTRKYHAKVQELLRNNLPVAEEARGRTCYLAS